jgi:restriction system protein
MADLSKETLIKLYETLDTEELEKLGIYEQAKLAYEEKQTLENLKKERIEKARALINEAIELLNIYDFELIVRNHSSIIISKKTDKKGGSEATRGVKTPQADYVIPILEALVDLGGRGRVAEVLDLVYEKVKEILTPFDHEMLPSGLTERWRNTAQWARNEMVTKGLLRNDSPRGFWEISEKGKNYLKEHSNG